MIIINNTQKRNLEEQVAYLTEVMGQTIDVVKNVVGIVPNAVALPNPELYVTGTTYAVGTSAPYHYYVDMGDKWVDLGTFPAAGPAGENGKDGYSIWASTAPAADYTTTLPIVSLYNPSDIEIKIGDLVVAGDYLFRITNVGNINIDVQLLVIMKGKDSTGLKVIGSVNYFSQLPETAELGTSYFVGTTYPRNVYTFVEVGGVGQWQNQGRLEGAQGPQGIPGSPTFFSSMNILDEVNGVNFSNNTANFVGNTTFRSDDAQIRTAATEVNLPIRPMDGLNLSADPITNNLVLTNNKSIQSFLVVTKPNGYALRIQFKDLSYVETPIITESVGLDKLTKLSVGIEQYSYTISPRSDGLGYTVESILTGTDEQNNKFNVQLETYLPFSFGDGLTSILGSNEDGQEVFYLTSKYISDWTMVPEFDGANFETAYNLVGTYNNNEQLAPNAPLFTVSELNGENLDNTQFAINYADGDAIWYDNTPGDGAIGMVGHTDYYYVKGDESYTKSVFAGIDLPIYFDEGIDAEDNGNGKLAIKAYRNSPILYDIVHGAITDPPQTMSLYDSYIITVGADDGYMVDVNNPDSIRVVGVGDYQISTATDSVQITLDHALSAVYIKVVFIPIP